MALAADAQVESVIGVLCLSEQFDLLVFFLTACALDACVSSSVMPFSLSEYFNHHVYEIFFSHTYLRDSCS